MRERRLDLWVPSYLRGLGTRRRLRSQRSRQLTHVLFLVCDHYEPRHAATRDGQPQERVKAWHSGYQEMQRHCEKEHGLRPLHTWFYPPHHGNEHLAPLAHMAFDGLGEVELHYHHDGDTEETLRADLRRTLSDFRRAGLLLQAGEPPVERFGFIHGDWALDNSAGGEFCGVDSELSLLEELGCWGDLTMPSANRCQTRKINSIYYAIDDPHQPKSHDTGENARVNAPDRKGLLMVQGPLAVNFGAPRYPRVENASLTTSNWGRPDRIRSWIDCHVHVEGRPEWLFVKLHTHGALEHDFDALFGKKARAMHALMAKELNDGKQYRLHYITARQAYNVIRAAEHGHGGDPARYFDYELGPQVTQFYCLNTTHRVECCTKERLRLSDIAADPVATLRIRYGSAPTRVSGALDSFSVDASSGVLEMALHGGAGEVTVEFAGAEPTPLQGATVRSRAANTLTLACQGPVRLQSAVTR